MLSSPSSHHHTLGSGSAPHGYCVAFSFQLQLLWCNRTAFAFLELLRLWWHEKVEVFFVRTTVSIIATSSRIQYPRFNLCSEDILYIWHPPWLHLHHSDLFNAPSAGLEHCESLWMAILCSGGACSKNYVFVQSPENLLTLEHPRLGISLRMLFYCLCPLWLHLCYRNDMFFGGCV